MVAAVQHQCRAIIYRKETAMAKKTKKKLTARLRHKDCGGLIQCAAEMVGCDYHPLFVAKGKVEVDFDTVEDEVDECLSCHLECDDCGETWDYPCRVIPSEWETVENPDAEDEDK
jgi:hypothetical protein